MLLLNICRPHFKKFKYSWQNKIGLSQIPNPLFPKSPLKTVFVMRLL